jgi:phytoene dehydrogenase-like protein
LLTPADLEAQYNMYGGHWHHGEISLDQIMMMRPFPGATQYATPVDNLYLCGAGAHPGGGVMGLAGRNAAREIIQRGKTA